MGLTFIVMSFLQGAMRIARCTTVRQLVWRLAAWAVVAGAPVSALVAQQPTATRATVRGTLYDSLLARPIPGAMVQLVGADASGASNRTVSADSLGRFVIPDVPSGRYTIGFLHPLLDSLGLDPMLHAVSVQDTRDVEVVLATPSTSTMRQALCGAASSGSSNAVIMGTVRDARTQAAVADAQVFAAWLELTLSGGRMMPRTMRRTTQTRSSGVFALCNVPGPGAVRLQASRSADSTDIVEVDVPANGFFRRDLFVGPARILAVADRADSTGAGTRTVRSGDARVTGTVTAAASERPLAGAIATISNGLQVRTSVRGDFLFVDAPPGTRTLDVRAVGYFPERLVIDVVEGAPPLQFALATLRSVLDTVKVRADYDRYSTLAEVRERMRSGLGRFLNADDIARRAPIVTTDLFRNFPGVYAERDGSLTMRGLFAERCVPAIYVNGTIIQNFTGDDLDLFVPPERILAVEVYAVGQAPPQFAPGLAGGSADGANLCGSMVFWTR